MATAFIAVLGAGCSGGSTSAARQPVDPCDQVARDVVSLTQRYVDTFNIDQTKVSASATPTPTASKRAAPAGISPQQYADAVAAARQRLAAGRCDQTRFHDALAGALPGLTSKGAIATAVLAQLRVSLTNALPSQPVTRSVTPRDNLPQVIAEIPDGSTLRLAAGVYKLTDSLVLLRPVTLRGVGRNATVITSDAADATVLVMTGGPVTLDSLSIRRAGATPGSGVVTGPTAQLTVHSVSVSGARASSDGSGGVGVLLTASGAGSTSGTVTFRASDSDFSDNAAAGVAAGGIHRTAITSSRFERDQQCGICFLGEAAGDIVDSTFAGNSVAVVVASSSAPTVRGNQITGGEIGIQASGSAQPTISDNTIAGTRRASMLFFDNSAGRVDGNNCSGDRAGIAVARSAYPYVGHNTCRVTLGA